MSAPANGTLAVPISDSAIIMLLELLSCHWLCHRNIQQPAAERVDITVLVSLPEQPDRHRRLDLDLVWAARCNSTCPCRCAMDRQPSAWPDLHIGVERRQHTIACQQRWRATCQQHQRQCTA